MGNGRTGAFFTAFFLTFCILMTALALLTVDHRCRTAMTPAGEITADFCYDSMADGEGTLSLQWFDIRTEIVFRPGEKLQTLLRALPVLIPRPLRAMALLKGSLPERPADSTKDGGALPPSFYLSIFEI